MEDSSNYGRNSYGIYSLYKFCSGIHYVAAPNGTSQARDDKVRVGEAFSVDVGRKEAAVKPTGTR